MKLYGDLDVRSAEIFEDTIELKGLQYATDDTYLSYYNGDDHEVVYTLHDKAINIYDGKEWKKFQVEAYSSVNTFYPSYTGRALDISENGNTFSTENSLGLSLFILPPSTNLKRGVFYRFFRRFPGSLFITVNDETVDKDTIDNHKTIKCSKSGLDGALEIMYIGEGRWISLSRSGQWEWEDLNPKFLSWVGDRAVFYGGSNSINSNIIDTISISTISNATYFGSLIQTSTWHSDASANGYAGRAVVGRGNGESWSHTFNIVTSSDAVSLDGQVGNANDWGTAMSSNAMLGTGLVGPGANNDWRTQFKFYNPVATASYIGGTPANQRSQTNACSNGILGQILIISGLNNGNWINHFNLNTLTAAVHFGYITSWSSNTWMGAGASNGVNNRAIIATWNAIDYVEILTPANSVLFGQMSAGRWWTRATSNANNNRAVINGGYQGSSIWHNTIDYVTIVSTGDAIDFGDLIYARWLHAAVSNA